MHPSFSPPEFSAERFNCPNCQAFAHMNWHRLQGYGYTNFYQAVCTSCSEASVWIGSYASNPTAVVLGMNATDGKMIYPPDTAAPHAHPDMPSDIAQDFQEARLVLGHSPRAAAALLRLCVQKICNHLLGRPGGIDEQIGQLVQQGLPAMVQKALDTVRVIGNEAVHPGTIDLNDTPEVAQALFKMVNLIVQDCITKPKEVEALYAGLPPGKLAGIERRDAKSKS